MATIAELLNELKVQQKNLAANLTSKGVEAEGTEKLNTLVPKVLDIPIDGIDTSDATATADDILLDKTAYANGKKITGTILLQEEQTIVPSTINKTISKGIYINGTQTIQGDENLIPENIKKGVSIFGVEGTCESGGSTDSSVSDLFDVSTFATADQTLATYGDTVYITEDGGVTFVPLSECGPTDSSKNSYTGYIGDAGKRYGIYMNTWAATDASSVDNGILFLTPVHVENGHLIYNLCCGISSWTSQSLKIQLIQAEGNDTETLLTNIKEKIADDNLVDYKTFSYPGSSDTKEYLTASERVISAGDYYLYISGTQTRTNNNFYYIAVNVIDY